ncbi:MAG: beta-lactamase family protein [Myxococcales bacterium]|nr:beta-lactamase family protein [Myxococcales bacterium]
MDAVESLLDRAVADGVTPGGQLSVRWRDRSSDRALWRSEDLAFGGLTYDPSSPRARTETLYDLASVSKAVFALAAISWADREKLPLATPAEALWPESRASAAGRATLEALLSHRSELRAWEPLFRHIAARDAGTEAARATLFAKLFEEPLEPNGSTARYSDLGYITAGEAVATASGRSLGTLVRERVIEPLAATYGALTLGYRAVHEYRGVDSSEVAPTELCAWRGEGEPALVQGLVHDENCYAFGGVCGHAGLFGTARDLAILGEASLRAMAGEDVGDGWVSASVLRAMATPREGGTHRLGWDAKSPAGSSAGERASMMTFGHLGFTGTMLWCDPDAELCVALVTNRVHPTRENNGIRALRPAVMDAVLSRLRGA